jgi:glycosyltransferase involved in cell wall biosynthesis
MTGVSIIIPVYNAEMYISGAVESALSQEYPDKEIIAVDDGSHDGTQDVLRPYRENGDIRYIRQSNSGPSTARNTGISLANGRYITFLDADDLLAPGYLQTVTTFLDDYSMIDFVFTNYELFSGSGPVIQSGVDRWKAFRKIPHVEVGRGAWLFTESLTKYIIKYGGFMTTSCVTVRKKLCNGGNTFREGYFYGEDDEFFARVNYTCKAGYIDRVLMKKRGHTRSLTHDRSRTLRNVAHFIKLSEIQRDYFSGDPEIQEILGKKIPALIFDYCWHLIDQRKFSEAQKILFTYLKQYKKSLSLYKLLVKNWLFRLYCSVG